MTAGEPIIGHEESAQEYEQKGDHVAAAIHRLTPRQARLVLIRLSVYDEQRMAEAIAGAIAGERRVDAAG